MLGDPLFSAAPSFDQPLAVLKHCHDRIRKQLATLNKLVPHLQAHGADEQAKDAAKAILRYFTQAAPLHHEDEERDLLPALISNVRPEDEVQFKSNLSTILQQHETMAELWNELQTQLSEIVEKQLENLDPDLIKNFNALYVAHMEIEEQYIAPLASRTLSASQFAQIALGMQQRRGLANT